MVILELLMEFVSMLVKYFDSFRKYYKVYRYNNWGSIINDKYIIDIYNLIYKKKLFQNI